MSKLYFAKYLPVEGEIKENDTFLEHGISYRLLSKRKDDWVICTRNLEKQFADVCKDPKKSKLFLCSRDIQVGDKVIDSTDGKEYEVKEGLLSPEMVKVIGEISPDATWVKEGDEFDKEQLGMEIWYKYGDTGWAIGKHGGWMNKPEELIGTNIFAGDPPHGEIKSIDRIFIYIKCPTCGNFH